MEGLLNKNKKLLIIHLWPYQPLSSWLWQSTENSYAYDLDFNVNVEGTTIKIWAGFGGHQ